LLVVLAMHGMVRNLGNEEEKLELHGSGLASLGALRTVTMMRGGLAVVSDCDFAMACDGGKESMEQRRYL
jgi:hypothetical protein